MKPNPADKEKIPLFSTPDLRARELLEAYGRILGEVVPLKDKHRRSLPGEIRELSHILTSGRSEPGAPEGPKGDFYLQKPGVRSAYLYYFLPWNLVRIASLLSGPEFSDLKAREIIDLGSGPLTFPQALYLSRPDVYAGLESIFCLDVSAKTMQTGYALLDGLIGRSSGKGGNFADGGGKKVRLIDAPWRRGMELIGRKADLITAVNFVNEIAFTFEKPLAEQLGDFADFILEYLNPGGRLLIIEPGTRRSGRIISFMREQLFERGLVPLAPCPHTAPCPLLSGRLRSWCHFRFPVQDAPLWLAKLSEQAYLPKKTLSLSFLYVEKPEKKVKPAKLAPGTERVRVVSEDFPVGNAAAVKKVAPQEEAKTSAKPGKDKPTADKSGGRADEAANAAQPASPKIFGRYGCTSKGLALILSEGKNTAHGRFSPGDSLELEIPAKIVRDEKSGAREVRV